jgi:hypothetical protein
MRIVLKRIFVLAFLGTILISPSSAVLEQTEAPTAESQTAVTLFGIKMNCDPAKAPGAGGCGIRDFVYFLKQFIKYLTVVIVPLAVFFIVWGGLVILLAGGSPERVGKGKKMITTALIGVAIALSAWLIINTVFLALTGASIQ